MKFIRERHDSALDSHELEKARFYSDELRKEREKLKSMEDKHKLSEHSTATVTRDDIERIVAERTGVSMGLLRQSRAPRRV
ncbi:MAG TPA: hypothetical protein VI685_03805 [Candidatus Angelobacter sp.]